MHCAHCGAPVQREWLARGSCFYCDTVLPPQGQAKTLEGGLEQIFGALAMGAPGGVQQVSVTTQAFTTIVIDGKTYARPEDMPPDVRARYEAKMQKLVAMGLVPKAR